MSAQDPTLLICSSSEGLEVAENLQRVLDDYFEATVWNQGVFGLSGTGIASLVQASRACDFAALILTPDDVLLTRGRTHTVVRDNVLFEAGLFVGAIGLERTFLVSCRDDDLDLPSDLDGVTRATYRRRSDGQLRAALSPVGLQIREAMDRLGLRKAVPASPVTVSDVERSDLPPADEAALLQRELTNLTTSAQAQGWTVKTNPDGAYWLVDPDGFWISLTLGAPWRTRRDYGLLLSRALLTPNRRPDYGQALSQASSDP